MPQAEVVFCGQSLYISVLASGLQSREGLRVIRVESEFPQMAEELKMLHPDVVVFERNGPKHDGFIEEFQKKNSRILLIGVDPQENALTILTRNGLRGKSVDDLESVILEGIC